MASFRVSTNNTNKVLDTIKNLQKINENELVCYSFIYEIAYVTDLLYRCPKTNYSDKYELTMDHCIAIDVNTSNRIAYSRIDNGEVNSALIATVDEMKKLM